MHTVFTHMLHSYASVREALKHTVEYKTPTAKSAFLDSTLNKHRVVIVEGWTGTKGVDRERRQEVVGAWVILQIYMVLLKKP